MISCTLIHRYPRQNGLTSNRPSISTQTGIRIHISFSIDLLTAQHPQTLLATHLNGKPLTVERGAPLWLLVSETRPEKHQGYYANYLWKGQMRAVPELVP